MKQQAYFPYRAHKNRPYITEFLALPEKERRWEVLAQMSVFRTGNSFGEDARKSPLAHACRINESWLSTAISSFFGGGQVIFHVSPVLRDAFLSSDLGDATAEDLKFPFPHSYLHVGKELGLSLNGGLAQLEGVFLETRLDGTLMLTLVGGLVDEPEHWGFRGMESFTLFFSEQEMTLPLLEAAKSHLERKALDPLENEAISNLEEFDEEERGRIRENWEIAREERRLQRENIPVVLECVRLVANAMLYLNQYPEDIADGYQEGFPLGYRQKIERSTGKTRERTLSRARHEGFTYIKRIGAIYEKSVETGVGVSPGPHLRRAHWRRQAHGPGLSLRKLLWIHAVKVLGGQVRDRPYLIVDGAATSEKKV